MLNPISCENLAARQQAWYDENAPLGRELGYPECCIRAFANDCPEALELPATDREKQWRQIRYLTGHIDGKFTGFIPCKKHAILIALHLRRLRKLIKGRSPLFPPFPQYANDQF